MQRMNPVASVSASPQFLVRRALGLMSGTSADGVDVALIETDGRDLVRRLWAHGVAYPDDVRATLLAAMAQARTMAAPEMTTLIQEATEAVTQAHQQAIMAALREKNEDRASLDVVGFHGQTLAHRPERGWTWQVGDGGALALALGVPVVTQFRQADVAAGGQGAPLVPIYHAALAAMQEKPGWPLAVVNIGGVANVTWLAGPDSPPLACDVGPGNALMDDWVAHHTGARCDVDGALAAVGRVDERALAGLLDSPWFAAPLPKSLDRNDFSLGGLTALTVADGAATLTAFTVAAIARSAALFPATPRSWVIVGGGRHNPTLMAQLRGVLGGAVVSAEQVGWHGDSVEAEAFAYLAVRSLEGLPLTFPTTTGAPRPLPGGVLFRPI